uniref:FAD dependent oxidoreductase domain-containing protein n=1 Tax=Bionectria ochroleuca TaxID=29856 RepID=A0A0B7JWW2_BIOOC
MHVLVLNIRQIPGPQPSRIYKNVVPEMPRIRERAGKTYTYVIPRLDGTVILGGIRDPDISNTKVDLEVDKDIARRVNKTLPEHFSADPADYDIVGHNVGIRPYRSTGMRIEKEVKEGQNIVHAYGITGGGYIFGFGVAREAAGLVDEFLFPAGKARL